MLLPGCPTKEGPPLGPHLYKDLSSDGLTRVQVERRQRIRSVRAQAKVKLIGPRGKFGFSEAINAIRPDRLRLDTIGPFGRVFSVIATDGEGLVFMSPGERRVYTGEPTAENISRFLPFALAVEDVVAVLLGGLPESELAPSVSYDEEEAALVVRTVNKSGSVSLATFDVRTLDLRRLQIIDPPPRLAAVVDYEGWMPRDGIDFPSRISIRVPSRDVLMHISFKKVEPNAAIEDIVFRIPAPRGFEIFPMEFLPPPVDHNLTPGLEPVPVDAPADAAGGENP